VYLCSSSFFFLISPIHYDFQLKSQRRDIKILKLQFLIFREKEKKKKKCKDLGVDQNLKEFSKIPMSEYLKKKMGIFEILIGFNGKS
jgi:hypothetical protein